MSALKPLSFGAVSAPNNLMFAPLAGFSHKSMRMCMREFGAGYSVTEMVSIEGVLRNSRKTFRYADISDAPETTSVQLFGSDPARFAEAALLLQETCGTKSININFGCPAPKVQKGGGGSELLKNPKLMTAIVRALKQTGLTVEAKIRAGFDCDDLEHLIEAVEDADCIILHCRLVKDKFISGTADWNRFARARALSRKTLIANGDIKSPEDALEILKRYGADGVMIGRAALACPYLFTQILELDRCGVYRSPSPNEKIEMILSFARLWLDTEHSEDLTPIRGALMSRSDRFEGAVKLRSLIAGCRRWDELVQAVHYTKEHYTIKEETL